MKLASTLARGRILPCSSLMRVGDFVGIGADYVRDFMQIPSPLDGRHSCPALLCFLCRQHGCVSIRGGACGNFSNEFFVRRINDSYGFAARGIGKFTINKHPMSGRVVLGSYSVSFCEGPGFPAPPSGGHYPPRNAPGDVFISLKLFLEVKAC